MRRPLSLSPEIGSESVAHFSALRLSVALYTIYTGVLLQIDGQR